MIEYGCKAGKWQTKEPIKQNHWNRTNENFPIPLILSDFDFVFVEFFREQV